MTRLTKRRLEAMANAVNAMLASGGPDEGGDWSPDISVEDMEAAADWIGEQIAKREQGKRA